MSTGALRLYLFIFYKEVFFISKDAPQLNGEIRDKELRVISDTGEQLGIMSAKEAQALADARGVDLVKIAPMAKPPVCKIMDLGKFIYEQSKKEKEAKKKQKVIISATNPDTGESIEYEIDAIDFTIQYDKDNDKEND